MLLMGKSTISIAIFNSYVKLPEGNLLIDPHQGLPKKTLKMFESGTGTRRASSCESGTT